MKLPKIKSIVLEKIKEIYPNFKNSDLVILFGSRAYGLEVPESDIDVLIFTKNYDYYKKQSIKKSFRKKGENPGFELKLKNKFNTLLEVKIKKFEVPKFDVMFYFDLLYSKPLNNEILFKKFNKQLKDEFSKNYNELLFKSYIHFFNEFKQMQGMVFRKGKIQGIELEIKKGIVLQALFRLILTIQKIPYCSDKWIYHFVLKSKQGRKVKYFVNNIEKVNSYKNWIDFKIQLQDFINKQMPKKPYVGAWYKYLDEFRELK